jgi:hypothetical protein
MNRIEETAVAAETSNDGGPDTAIDWAVAIIAIGRSVAPRWKMRTMHMPHAPDTKTHHRLKLQTREGTHLAVMPPMRARHTRDRSARMDFMLMLGQ